MTVLMIAALVLVSTWLAWPPPRGGRLERVGLGGDQDRGPGPWSSEIARLQGHLVLGPWRRRRKARSRIRLIEAVGALAAELQAGQPPQVALQRSAGEPPAWPTTLAAIRLHAPVADALRADADQVDSSQRELLCSMAACWEATEVSGSGLSAAIGRLAATARQSEEIRVQLEGELAAPRATARLLACLPAFGVLIGFALGIDPLGWLLGGPLGWACLAGAIVLIALGLAWTGRISAAVEQQL